MGEEHINKKEYAGRITSGIKAQTFQLAIINFVQQQLPFWRDDPDRPLEQSERKLNSQLYKFLDHQARISFPLVHFGHEEPQHANRDVDISVLPDKSVIIEAQAYTIYDPVLVIECKRLPAPSPKERKKEYVTGLKPNKIGGGIQRFKLGLHGAKHDLAAMIGYIQDSSHDWYSTINKWISELVENPIGDGNTWHKNETLRMLEEDTIIGIAKYHSVHNRIGDVANNKIELYHLWVKMNYSTR